MPSCPLPSFLLFHILLSLLVLTVFGDIEVVDQKEEEWRNCDFFFAPSSTFGGWGIFAARPFRKNEIVELALITIPMPTDIIRKTILIDYIYTMYAEFTPIFFGQTHFYNNQPEANIAQVIFGKKVKSESMVVYVATRDIDAGDELFTTYTSDGGESYFRYRGLEMRIVEESKVAPEDLEFYKKDYCSKIYAGLGRPMWDKYESRRMYPRERLPPFDAGYADARAKESIKRGERIEIATGMLMVRSPLKNTTLAALGIVWEDLSDDQKGNLTSLREEGLLHVAEVTRPKDVWGTMKYVDVLDSFENLFILSLVGSLAYVRRVGMKKESNCRLLIHSNEGVAKGSVILELVATRDIEAEDVLKLNLPKAGNEMERKMLHIVLHDSKRPYNFEHFVESDEDSADAEL